jgi:isopenicillin-N N-acyltransferase-like protein
MVAPFPLIEIAGPPRERGRQYGRQAAARLGIANTPAFTMYRLASPPTA